MVIGKTLWNFERIYLVKNIRTISIFGSVKVLLGAYILDDWAKYIEFLYRILRQFTIVNVSRKKILKDKVKK